MHLQGCLGAYAEANLQSELRIDVAVFQKPGDPSAYKGINPGSILVIPCYLRPDTPYRCVAGANGACANYDEAHQPVVCLQISPTGS